MRSAASFDSIEWEVSCCDLPFRLQNCQHHNMSEKGKISRDMAAMKLIGILAQRNAPASRSFLVCSFVRRSALD